MTTDAEQRQRLTQWVAEHGPAVRGFLLACVGDRTLADDLTQEVFARAWRYRDRHEARGRDRSYLIGIADRLAKGRRVRMTSREPFPEPSVAAEPLQDIVRDEQRQLLRQALDLLSESQRRTLLLHYFGDLTFVQIAEKLGCPVSTALSHARRGLLALKQLLTETMS